MKKLYWIVIVGLLCFIVSIYLNLREQRLTTFEITEQLEAEEKKDVLSEKAKKFILLYSEGSREYEKYLSSDFSNAASTDDNEESHHEHSNENDVNIILSSTTFSNNIYSSEIVYQFIEKLDGYPIGRVLLKANIEWVNEKIKTLNIEIVG